MSPRDQGHARCLKASFFSSTSSAKAVVAEVVVAETTETPAESPLAQREKYISAVEG